MVFRRKSVEETDPTKIIERSFRSNGYDGRIIDLTALAIQTETTNDMGRLKEVHNSLVDNFYKPYKSLVKSGNFSADDINDMLNKMGRLWGLANAFAKNPHVSSEVRERLIGIHRSVLGDIEDAKANYIAALTKSRQESMASIEAYNRDLSRLDGTVADLRAQIADLQLRRKSIEKDRVENTELMKRTEEELRKLMRS